MVYFLCRLCTFWIAVCEYICVYVHTVWMYMNCKLHPHCTGNTCITTYRKTATLWRLRTSRPSRRSTPFLSLSGQNNSRSRIILKTWLYINSCGSSRCHFVFPYYVLNCKNIFGDRFFIYLLRLYCFCLF